MDWDGQRLIGISAPGRGESLKDLMVVMEGPVWCTLCVGFLLLVIVFCFHFIMLIIVVVIS